MNRISEIAVHQGRPFLRVDGRPFPFIGTQLRADALCNCMHLAPSDLEPYFAAAARCGFPLIQIPVDWRDLEPAEDAWRFDEVDALLALAAKYGLRMEYLWFSTNMCGDTHSYHVPDYVLNDAERFPRLQTPPRPFHPYYGDMLFLQLDAPQLLARETRAARKLMEHTARWDRKHGSPHTVIGVQVHNEPNCLPDWRLDQFPVVKDGLPVTRGQAWDMILRALDAVGSAFHSDDYRIYTRVNLAVTDNPVPWGKKIAELEGIDMVGNDPYTEDLQALMASLALYRQLDGNFPHIAENKAIYPCSAAMLLRVLCSGGGYCLYDLSTPPFFIENSDEAGIDHGLLDRDLRPRTHTGSVCGAIRLVRSLYPAMWEAGFEGIRLLNVQNGIPENEFSAALSLAQGELRFETDCGACGVLVPDGRGGHWFASHLPSRMAWIPRAGTQNPAWKQLSAAEAVHL